MGGANPQLGRILFYFNSDTVDAAPQTKAVLMNYSAAGSCKISDDYAYSPRFTGKNQQGELFVPENVTVLSDQPDYLWGRMIIATDGCQTTGVVGDLFVEYDVTLITPKLSVGLGMNLPLTQLQLTETYIGAGSDWMPGAGGSIFRNDFNISVSGEVITIPAGNAGAFLIMYTWAGAGVGSAWVTPTVTFTNLTGINAMAAISGATTSSGLGSIVSGVTLGTGCPRFVSIGTVRIDDPSKPSTITFSGGNRAVDGVVTCNILMYAIEPFP